MPAAVKQIGLLIQYAHKEAAFWGAKGVPGKEVVYGQGSMMEVYKERLTKYTEGWMIRKDFVSEKTITDDREIDEADRPLMIYVKPSNGTVFFDDEAPYRSLSRGYQPRDKTMFADMAKFQWNLDAAVDRKKIEYSTVTYEQCTEVLTSTQSAMSDKERKQFQQVCLSDCSGWGAI